MFNYYINEKLVESYPKGNPREFKFGETHRIEVINAQEDESTRVENEVTDIKEYQNYDYKISRLAAYGTVMDQLEFITENGLDAWQDKVNEIKNRYPKPSE